jgi:hypothetical protein
VIDGDESNSEFIFTGFVLVGSFPACIGFIGFVIILQSGVPFTQVGTGPVSYFIVMHPNRSC